MTRTQPAAADLHRLTWERARRRCAHCQTRLALEDACLDEIKPGRKRTLGNLRCLCRRCLVLRCGPEGNVQPVGVIAQAIKDGVIPEDDWVSLVWDG
jgi:hypothetical protein